MLIKTSRLTFQQPERSHPTTINLSSEKIWNSRKNIFVTGQLAILSTSDPKYYTENDNTNEHKLHLVKFGSEKLLEANAHVSHK